MFSGLVQCMLVRASLYQIYVFVFFQTLNIDTVFQAQTDFGNVVFTLME